MPIYPAFKRASDPLLNNIWIPIGYGHHGWAVSLVHVYSCDTGVVSIVSCIMTHIQKVSCI